MRFVLLGAFLFLSGCMGPQTHTLNNQYQAKFKAEWAAWNAVEVAAKETCGASLPPPPKEAIKYSKCKSRLIEQKVLPIAAYPDLLIGMRAKAATNAKHYSEGKLSKEEYIAYGQENFTSYIAKVDERYYAAMNGAIQRDQLAAQHNQQTLQSLAIISSQKPQIIPMEPSGASCRYNSQTGTNQQCFHVLPDGGCAHFGMGC